MRDIILTDKIKTNLIELGSGSEGKVFKFNEKAMKIFYDDRNKKTLTMNKIEKIKILGNIKLENFITPEELILDKNGKIIGYTMDYIEAKTDLYDITTKKDYTLKEKIQELKRLEKILKDAHQHGLTVGDMSLFNFLKDKKNNTIAIDTDNYKVHEYENDILPSIGYPFYHGRVTDKVDPNLDKFLFGMYTIRSLIKPDSNPMLSFCDGAVIGYSDDNEYLEELVDALLVDQDFKKELLDLFSCKLEKKYIADKLDFMVSRRFQEQNSYIELDKVKMLKH